MKRRLLSLLFALALLCSTAVAANAHEVPNASRKGSISVTMKYDGKAVPGGELTIYKVGDVAEDDGNYDFTPTANFAGKMEAFTDISSPTLAKTLSDYAKTEWSVAKATADNNGKVKFSGLEIGLYLVVQTKTADDYDAIKPFLVSIPYYDEDNQTYKYDVNASSKMSTITYNPPPETTAPTTPPSGNLPQTGQLNWPVPVLAVGGLVLIAVGWMLRSDRKKEENAQ